MECRSLVFKFDDAATLRVPYAFRVLATMNSYDRSLLYKLGYALRRRFAIIEFERVRNIDMNYLKESFKKKLLGNEECRCEEVDISKVLFPLPLSRGDSRTVCKLPQQARTYEGANQWRLSNYFFAKTLRILDPLLDTKVLKSSRLGSVKDKNIT